MLRPRISPCLLVHNGGLVKTDRFKAPKYVGDPINAVKIFNEKQADELIVLDIDATVNGAEPDYNMIETLALECRMPLCYGGGIKSVKHASRIIGLGVEKVALSSVAFESPELVSEISEQIGRQSVAVIIDVKKQLFGRNYEAWTHNAKRNTKRDPFEFAKQMAALGAGEIIFNSIDRDGVMNGYDLDAAMRLRHSVNLPITILGGAGGLNHIRELYDQCGVVGASAGSLFVFKGSYKAVLITYPSIEQKDALFNV